MTSDTILFRHLVNVFRSLSKILKGNMKQLLITFLLLITCAAHASETAVKSTHTARTYSCPQLVTGDGHKQKARSLSLFSGPPSEMASLKPDNDDEDNAKSYFWNMVPEEEYWYVCDYKNSQTKHEFKLPKGYETCTVTGAGEVWDKLKCK